MLHYHTRPFLIAIPPLRGNQYLHTNIPAGWGVESEVMSNVLFCRFGWETLLNIQNFHVFYTLYEK